MIVLGSDVHGRYRRSSISNDAIVGGETEDDIMEEEVRKTFDEQLARLRGIRKRKLALELMLEMRNRVSTKSLDKVAGLAYLLYSDSIPIYDAEKSDAEAGERAWQKGIIHFSSPSLSSRS